MGREFELKYTATPETLAAIRAEFAGWSAISMETAYFDTPDGQLSSKKCTLRQRLENGISVCTMKTPAAGFARGEWNVKAGWSAETVQKLFADAGQPPIPFETLITVCGARFTRLATQVVLPNCTVEIALDTGILMGADRQLPLCELEVECKGGDEMAVAVWAQQLAARYALQQEKRSKFKRASALAKGE